MKRSEALGIRKALDNLESMIGLVDETVFNAKAGIVNDNVAAFRRYNPDKDYVRGDIAVDPADNVPYWAIHSHGPSTGQVWQPSLSPTIWMHCHGTSPETARPFVAESHNPYMVGHYCIEDGVPKRCIRNNTVHAPSVLPEAWSDK